jgi:hypothetical protein
VVCRDRALPESLAVILTSGGPAGINRRLFPRDRGAIGPGRTRPERHQADDDGENRTLFDPAKRPLWSVGAEQWNPLRLMADGLFARDPSALPPHRVRTVREQLQGYRVQRRPVTADILERFLAGESIADLTRVDTLPTQEVETIVRHELAARRHEQQQ